MRRWPARFLSTRVRSARFVAFVAFCTLLLTSVVARAYTPPPIEGPITDPLGKLAPADKQALSDKLRGYKDRTGNEITYLIAPSLDGEDIADVAYDTAKAWKLGSLDMQSKQADVLVVLAPNERKIRIETAKGAEGDLTDLQTQQIIQGVIGPRLKADDFRGAIDQSSDAIIQALGDNAAHKKPVAGEEPASLPSVVGVAILLIILILLIAKSRGGGGGRGGGGPFFWFGGGGWGGGGGGGGFGGGGGGFGGGGGSWGGGGGGGGWGGGGSSGSY